MVILNVQIINSYYIYIFNENKYNLRKLFYNFNNSTSRVCFDYVKLRPENRQNFNFGKI